MNEITTRWVRNASDELAIEEGCTFDVERGAWTVWWIERYCRLYEGENAGEPVLMRCGNPELDKPILTEWDSGGKEKSVQRCLDYLDWIETKPDQIDWQYDCTMSVFGWVRYSEVRERDIRRFNQSSVWIPKKQKKALALETPIPTPEGWTTVKDISIGDMLFDVNGKQCKVIDKTETYLDRDCYRVNFSNGESVVCDAGHLWVTSSLLDEVSKGSIGSRIRTRPFRMRTTEEIFKTQKRKDGAKSHSLQMPKPIEMPDAELEIDPYAFGFWLGDGDSDGARITFATSDEKEVRKVLEHVGVRQSKPQKAETTKRAGIGEKFGDIRTRLRNMGVLHDKHIPKKYLRASVQQRIALLQGLMDTDGHAGKCRKMLIFATSNSRIMDGFSELLSSLGIKFSVNFYEDKQYWRFQFVCFSDDIPAFRFERKIAHQPVSHERKWNRSKTVQIVSVVKVPSVPVQCIAIDSEDKQFLFGKTMLPTHNTPTIASWSVYLTCGDGEQGGKTFGGAKDGTQARIAAEHAIAMVEQSPELSKECKINQNEKMIRHLPSRSFYKPLSSSDSRSKKSKEGINGNIAIDETHVVDREFIKIISRAGISRAEPLRFDFSTAGNNPDGYGKERQDYVRKVIAGEIKNTNLFGRIYEAPQDSTDEDIKADPIKFGKLANPAWGHTANREEFLSDFEESKQSPSLFADFKMYRLNIWQQSENPWLRMDDWKANADQYDVMDFAGDSVWLGLDLSKTRDMTAISMIFKSNDYEPIFYQFPLFWLPEKYARENKDKVEFLDWAESGHLELVPGETVKLSYIKEKMKWIDDNFNVIDLSYDKTYAYDLIDEFCEDELRWDCAEFKQSVSMYAGPTENYEAMLVEKRLKHNNHPVLNWQAGHVQVKTNEKNGKIPCKPKRDDVKKIDGIVAGIMALHRAYHGEDYKAGQFYEESENWISG